MYRKPFVITKDDGKSDQHYITDDTFKRIFHRNWQISFVEMQKCPIYCVENVQSINR